VKLPAIGKLNPAALGAPATLCLLAVVVLAFWSPCLFGRMAPLLGDAQANMLPWRAESPPPPNPRWDALLWDGMAQFYPWRAFAARTVRAGWIPLWNPHQFCGAPFVANGQSAVFYPPNWLFYLLDVRYALGLTAALHYLLTGCFMVLLARELGLRPVSGLVGAIAFAFGGFIVSWTELPTLMNTAVWLPGVVWSIERAFRRREPLGGLLVAFMLAMALLAGHLQIAVYVWLVGGLHLCARLAWALYRRDTRGLLGVVVAVPLAGLVASLQLLPTLELAQRSPRGTVRPTEEGFEFRRARALQPLMLETFVLPDALGTPDDWNRGGLAYSETCGYVGKLTLLLALCALLGLRSRKALWFAAFAALALLGAMGTPVARLLYFHVPGLGQAGGFGRLLCVYTFAVALLAAMGADWLTTRLAGARSSQLAVRLAAWVPIIAAAVVCAEVGSWALGFLPLSPRARVYPSTEVTTRLAVYSGRSRVLAVTPRANWIIQRRPEALLPPNSATAYGYDSVQGYDSLLPAVYEQLAAEVNPDGHAPVANGNMVLLDNASAEALNEAAVKWLALPAGREPPPDRYVWRWSGSGVTLWENRDAWPRARLKTAQGLVIPVHIERDADPNRMACTLGYPLGGKVIVADTFYPGWTATVEGRSTPLELHAPMFRKVAVQPGERCVEMVYGPASFAVGAFISLTMLGVAASWVMWPCGRKHRRRSVDQTKARG
jgi:hypothetical protein